MKFKTVSRKTLVADAPLVLGAVGGVMVGRGLTSVISKPAGTTPTESELNKKTIIQGILAIGGFVGYSAIDGNDTMSNATKGASIGIAIYNTISVIGTLVSKSPTITAKLSADTKLNTFAKSALGLACPYDQATLNRPRRRALRYPVVENELLLKGDQGLFD